MATKMLIQFSTRQEAAALPILLRHSPGIVLPERKYVITLEAAQALRDAGIEFSELGGETNAPNLEGAAAGERV
jgi:hypothetical protein